MVIITCASCLFLKAVLKLHLSMRCKAVTCRQVNSPQILAPGHVPTVAVGNIAKELLVPAKRAEQLRRKFVFRLKIVGEGVRIAYPRNFEARFVEFCPQLQVM